MDDSSWSLSSRPHVMVFDSAPEIRILMSELLEEERLRVTVSSFLPESFDQISASQPALLIIDLGFKEVVGWELLERLADDALTRTIPVLVTSTDQELLDRAELSRVRYGGQGWIVKPFDIDLIMAEVRRLLAPVYESASSSGS